MSIVSCRMCPETFATSTDLHHHVDMVHGSGSGAGPAPKRSRMDFDFPTAYHRLGSELLQENLPSGEPAQPQEEALSLTVPKAEPQQPREAEQVGDQPGEGRSVKVNGGRIFHMDAYCELCDREFCNKYFLKTHKASKHGITEDSPPPAPSAADMSQKSSPGGAFPHQQPPPPPPRVELSHSPWRQQHKDHKTENKQLSPTTFHKKSEADLAAEEKVSSVISAVKNSLQNSQSDSKSSSSSGSGSSSTKDPSMEDYCEFCQKHFCNKYYLKKHKQDVHGIIPETGPTTTKRSRASSSLLDLPMPASSMGSPMLLPQPMPSLPGMPSLPPGVMMLNPFMPQMTLIPAGNMPPPLLHAPPLHPPPHSPALSQSLPMPGAVPGLSPTTPTSQMSDFSPNPDTYCNLCNKEFSTVYFLRIHKANKHGIHSDDIPPEAKMLGDMVESNGIVVHPRPPSMDEKEGGFKSSPPPLTSISQMVTCRLCDKDFPNAQAFRIHQVNEHGKTYEPALPDSYESSLPKAEPPVSTSLRRMSADLPPAHSGSSNNGPGGTMFGNMVAAKLADRVMCDICNKDLCNKYFLKAHKLKMHGIDTDKEEGNESGRDRSSSYDRYSPIDSSSKAQPLNMTMSPKHGPPPLSMPTKHEARDYSNGSREFKLEKPMGFKSFTDVPTFLSETINNEYLRRSTPQPPFKGFDYGMPGFPPVSSAGMGQDHLLGEGIDPEAYCDICKKEFCSKYFLRTHKENIHGIKTEVSTPSRSRAKPGPKPAASKINSMISSSSSSSNSILSGLPIPSMPFPFPPGMMMRGGGGGGGGGYSRGRDSFEKHHFRWKDPPTTNATARVTCDICHKELCNKYFLRTHKLKKHGIHPTDSTQSPMSDSPAPSENDAASAQASQPDNFLVDKGTGMVNRSEGPSVPHTIPLPPSERSSKPSEPAKMPRSEDEKPSFPGNHINNNSSSSSSNNSKHCTSNSNNNNNSIDTVTCHLCERKFRDMQWLSAHLMKDHAESYTPEMMDLRMLPPPLGPSPHFGAELEPKVCQVCRILLPNEISLKLHLLQEHNAQIRLQMDEAAAEKGQQASSSSSSRIGRRESVRSWRSKARKHAERKMKMFVCSYGDYRTHWLYKLQRHEKKAHGISANTKSKPKSTENGLQYDEDTKQFKCGLCPSRFRSHTYCQMHLREAHIHMMKDFVSRKRQRSADNKLSCRYCSFTTSFPFRLHTHVSRYHRHHPRPALPDSQEKGFPDMTPVACSETPPESLHSSPDHTTLEDTGFERPASGAQDLRKRPFGLEEGEEEGGASVSLADNFLTSSPVDSRVHQSLSASFRMSEFTP
ncbi:uncharacterized protein LOC143279686 [Babylonia areolata]|uniref:uncharacterized protein LOC143279686 n=1 Tax=Babylonia areolata TaxID=304850 RepID=UPI003FD64890